MTKLLLLLFSALGIISEQSRPEIHLPLKVISITSKFGPRAHPVSNKLTTHQGVDLAAPINSPVYAIGYGKVVFAGNYQNFGLLMVVKHANGISSHYAHLQKINCALGDIVSPGSVIAQTGTTGLSTGPHLHFELRHNGQAVNPQTLLSPPNPNTQQDRQF